MKFQKGQSGNPEGRPKGRHKSGPSADAHTRKEFIELVFDHILHLSAYECLQQPQRRLEFLRALLPYVTKRKVATHLLGEYASTEKAFEELTDTLIDYPDEQGLLSPDPPDTY